MVDLGWVGQVLPLIAAGAQPSPPVTALPALARAATGVCA